MVFQPINERWLDEREKNMFLLLWKYVYTGEGTTLYVG